MSLNVTEVGSSVDDVRLKIIPYENRDAGLDRIDNVLFCLFLGIALGHAARQLQAFCDVPSIDLCLSEDDV